MSSPAASHPIGAILAGGLASRFGGKAKGLHAVGGQRILDRIAAALQPVASEIVLVTAAPEAESWLPGSRVVPDRLPGRGSLTGIHAALSADSPPRDAIVIGWDMPFVTTQLLEILFEESRLGAYEAVVPMGPQGLEPCCAWYSGRARETAGRLAEQGEQRLGMFVESLPRVRRLTPTEIRARGGGDPAVLFQNVNTPEDLEEAERIAAGLR